MVVLELLACAGLASQGGSAAPQPARDLELTLVLKTPARTHAWWPIVVEAWAENHSSHPVPIVRAMDGSWQGWVEPFLAWQGTIVTADGRSSPTRTGGGGARCGNYESNWVSGILVVPPGGRERVLITDIRDLFLTERWPHYRGPQGSVGLRLEYVYRAQPSRPSEWDPEPAEVEQRFGKFAGVAPFRMVSAPLHLELIAPGVDVEELERELVLEIELEDGGRMMAFELPRGRARLRNVSARSHRLVRPDGGASVGLGEPNGLPYLRQRDGLDWHSQVVDLGPGETLEVGLEQAFRAREWELRSTHSLQLFYVWYGPLDYVLERLDLPSDFGPVAFVPPFQLHTPVFQITVASPLTVELVPTAPVPAGRRYRLSEVLRLVLKNTGEESLELANAERPLEIDIDSPDGTLHTFQIARPMLLPPHGQLELTSDPELGIDGWSRDELTGAKPANSGFAKIQRKGWHRPVRSEQVAFDRR